MKPMKLPPGLDVYHAMPTPTCGRFTVFLALGLLLALGGCASEEHAPERRDAGPRRKPPAPIAGQENFFDGKIGVDLRVGAWDLGAAKAEAGLANQDGGGRRHGGGMGGGLSMSGIGGARDVGGAGGGGRHHGGPEGKPGGGERPEGARPMMGSMGPAEMIHLQFTNRGTERAVLNIVDFVSPLGNFAVRPETLTLEPGQSLEVEPMSSRLGGPVTEVEATLVLQVAGKTEKKTVVLRAVLASPPEQAIPAATPTK